ncbi:MAG TPA: xanthine dehydrogenase family protein subunit M [Actinomycetota bacterium]
MISYEIEFHAPTELGEALSLLADRGDETTVLGGGMSLMPMMNLGIVKPEVVLSLNHLPELEYVREDQDRVYIGATVRHAQVLRDEAIRKWCPALSEAAAVVGDVQVRNRGTIGGSIAHADPAADYLPVLYAYGAEIKLQGKQGERLVPADEFFIDVMLTTRARSELVTEVQIPKQPPDARAAYRRLARVEGSFAIVNAAAVVPAGFEGARVAIGGVGSHPITIDCAQFLRDQPPEEALRAIDGAVVEASAGATADLHADSEYRRAMAGVLARRAVGGALVELGR